ncbi:LOW QUALITY PROTEIN: hypothetical protein CRUP_019949 [Coryphaenoides rupestris]|nr:LOW QUALITY PROTEIN: hypothetical protein CRUP_019949 [Coryphaenoides rupestris]
MVRGSRSWGTQQGEADASGFRRLSSCREERDTTAQDKTRFCKEIPSVLTELWVVSALRRYGQGPEQKLA